METVKIHETENGQIIYIPEKYKLDTDEVLFQEHELGVLIIDPKKRWENLEKVMGTMGEDFFPNGREED